MAITFGSDGTLYCNSIKRNWGVARNLMPYNSGAGKTFDGNTLWWNGGQLNGYQTGSIYATRSYFHWTANSGQTVSMGLPKLYSGHKIYISYWYYAASGTSLSSLGIRSTSSGSAISGTKPRTSADGSWHFFSNVITLSSDYSATTWSTLNTNFFFGGGISVTRVIIFSINEAFNDTIANSFTDLEWKNWIDATLREHRTFSTLSNINWYQASGVSGQSSSTDFNKNSIYDGGSLSNEAQYPREWFIQFNTDSSSPECCYTLSGTGNNLTNGYYYYGAMYFRYNNSIGKTNDIYFPVAEPTLGGGIPIIATTSKYGYAKQWRIVSAYNIRNNWNTGNYTARFDLNHSKTTCNYETILGWMSIMPVMNSSSSGWFYYYNLAWNTANHSKPASSLTATSTGINRYFFDCWVDGYSQPIIHCPSPLSEDRKIQFNTTYDIICNDLIIEPWQTKVYYDSFGRVHCRGISPTTQIFV